MLSRPHYIANEIYRKSTYGSLHPLSIPRVSSTTDLITALGWLDPAVYRESSRATPRQLARFHDPAYIAALQQAEHDGGLPDAMKQRFNIGVSGNPIYREVFSRPATSVGGTLLAVSLLKDGGVVHSPAGGTHHGRRDHASGFCYFNDPVMGCLAFLDQGLRRVAYVDLDAHHGDGVQDAFADDDRVLTISIHEDGRWPHSGPVHDRAGGMARNMPVPPGFNDDELAFLIENAVIPLLETFEPEALIIQCGCDGLADDPMSRLELSNRGIWRAVLALKRLAPRVLAVGGGGYNPWMVARCWAGIWGILNGFPFPDRLPEAAEDVLRQLTWRRRAGRNPPEHWFTTLADPPRHGPVREEVRALAPLMLREDISDNADHQTRATG